MTVVPFRPLPRDVLRDIVDMKLRAVARRIEESHQVPTTYHPAVLDALAERCTDPETGARNVDHVLRGSLLPALSSRFLERMASGAKPGRVTVGLAADGGWDIDVGEA
jgi:type VI secretion system protein VasG